MKKSNFNIRTNAGDLVEKTGYCFTYPDFYPDYEFAVYQTGNSINSDKRWIVIELSTGLGIGGNNWQRGKTRKAAIQETKEILDRIGKEAFVARVARVIENQTVVISGRAN